MKQIYCDHNATTPLHKDVQEAMKDSFALFGNPSSVHSFGRDAREKVEHARRMVAALIGAEDDEIIFTGCGSESNNTVLNLPVCDTSACFGCPAGKREIVTSTIEHPSVVETVNTYRQAGRTVYLAQVDEYGRVELEHLKSLLNERTGLVSVMMANNEIGTIQNIKEISRITHEAGSVFHTDAVQGGGKLHIDVKDLNVDFMSLSAHKIYGPKGIGALYVKRGTPFCALIHGGHQEEGRRAGTLNTLGIIGMGKAAEIAAADLDKETKRLLTLRTRLKDGIQEKIPNIRINGHPEHFIPNTLNVSFAGAEGEAILLYLDLEGIGVSTGSACASGSLDPSHVLLATGLGPELAHGSIRFSLGRSNTEADIDYILEKLPPVIDRVRKMSTF